VGFADWAARAGGPPWGARGRLLEWTGLKGVTEGMVMSEDSARRQDSVVTKTSPRSVSDTVARLTDLVASRGMKLFGVIDQSAEAQQAGLQLRATSLVMFGSPLAGTPVMAAAPLAALDLPLKVLVWDDGGQTKVSYTAPGELASRYQLPPELAGPLAGIDALADALVQR
jgi:uncharacterized protein (DUF302 family)